MSRPDAPEPSRRQVMAAGASLAGLGLTSFLGGSACAQTRAAPPEPRPRATAGDELLDQALERIAARFPDANIHRSNHAPMVSEALATLGRPEAIAPWLDAHLDDFERSRLERRPIEREHWREALGHTERYADWQASFLAEIEADGWPAVLRRWVPRLAPGLAGVATHGVIRTGHGARGLGLRDSPIRRLELATGLAYWAANHEQLPWDGSTPPGEKSVEAALARVETRLPAREPPRGNIVTGLRALRETPSFAPVAGWIDTSDPERTLTEMASAFARLYLRNPEHRIAFTHAVTAPSSLRLLAPYLDEETVRSGVRYAWQAAAGLYVVYGDPRRPAREARASGEREALVARAIESGGAHAIKLTEACLREEALSHDPVLLAAAEDAGESLTF